MDKLPELIGQIPGSFHLEKHVHGMLTAHRLKGEWFQDCEMVRLVIDQLMTDGPASIGFLPKKKTKPAFVPMPYCAEHQRNGWRGLAAMMWPDAPIETFAKEMEVSRERVLAWLSGEEDMPNLYRHAFANMVFLWWFKKPSGTN
jgi:hypothetical protein